MKKTYQTNLILVFLLTILTLYLVNSNLITTNILDYTKLFFTKLFPTSFLLLTITSLLINYKLIETISTIVKKNSTSIYIIIMSLFCGFPSGPKYIADLYSKNYLSKKSAISLLTFTHFPNPLFVLGPVATLLYSKKLAFFILLSIIIANFITFLIFHKRYTSTAIPQTPELPFSKALSQAIISSLKTQTLIYGTSLFFFLISLLITTYLTPPPLIFVLINGFFDLTKGIFSTPTLLNTFIAAYLILLFITFGSISIHIQIKSILMDANLTYKPFLIGRIISTVLALIIFSLLLLII